MRAKSEFLSLESGLVVMVQPRPAAKKTRYIPAKGSPDEVRRGKAVKARTYKSVGKLARSLERDGARDTAANFVRAAILGAGT